MDAGCKLQEPSVASSETARGSVANGRLRDASDVVTEKCGIDRPGDVKSRRSQPEREAATVCLRGKEVAYGSGDESEGSLVTEGEVRLSGLL